MKKIIAFSLILSYTATSCSDVLEKYPLDRPTLETFYNTAQEIQGGVDACYSPIRESTTDMYNFPIALDLMTDIGFPRQDADIKHIAKGEHTPRTSVIVETWSRSYAGIARCNVILDVIEEKAHLLTEDQINHFKGEALFLRGYYHARLVMYFGDVPLVLTQLKTVADAKKLVRTPKAEVIDQIFKDYTDAEKLLPLEYSRKEDKGRATKGVVNAYKARLALNNGMYEIAAASAQAVISSGKYKLYSKYGDLFQSKGLNDANNREILFSDQFSAIVNKYTALVLHASSRNTGGWSTMVPSQNLIDSYPCIDGKDIATSPLFDKKKPFENRDPRLKLSIVVPGERFGNYRYETHADSTVCYNFVTGTYVRNNDSYSLNAYTSFTGYCMRKYNDEAYLQKNTQCDYPIILCRYAEVLLIYAEAKIELNQIDQSVVDALNSIRRDRDDVKMPEFSLNMLSDKNVARKIVRQERKIELALEGFRYTDLRRWDLAELYCNKPIMGRPFKGSLEEWPNVTFDINGEPVYDYNNYKPHPSTDYRVVENRLYLKNTHELWPIPQTEIDLNSNFVQNPGY